MIFEYLEFDISNWILLSRSSYHFFKQNLDKLSFPYLKYEITNLNVYSTEFKYGTIN